MKPASHLNQWRRFGIAFGRDELLLDVVEAAGVHHPELALDALAPSCARSCSIRGSSQLKKSELPIHMIPADDVDPADREVQPLGDERRAHRSSRL